MVSFNYENLNYVMSQFLKLSCVSFSYVSISYVLAFLKEWSISGNSSLVAFGWPEQMPSILIYQHQT